MAAFLLFFTIKYRTDTLMRRWLICSRMTSELGSTAGCLSVDKPRSLASKIPASHNTASSAAVRQLTLTYQRQATPFGSKLAAGQVLWRGDGMNATGHAY